MPKKHRRAFAKPVSTPHHSLASSSRHHGQGQRSVTSVNDLISHLRRTQVTSSPEYNPQASSSTQRSIDSLRSVHPSLRNLLELPETAPPRPRPNARRTAIGGRRVRLTPGPPPPESWLAGKSSASQASEDTAYYESFEIPIYRLEGLPGTVFPGEKSFSHAVLKSMVSNWAWHLEYDGPFLSQIPAHMKELLLSYVAVYAKTPSMYLWCKQGLMRGLKPLFLAEPSEGEDGDESVNTDAGIVRLDLSCALGRWISLKQITNDLVYSAKSVTLASQRDAEEVIPTSWEDELHSEETTSTATTSSRTISVPKALDQPRFKNLRYLSFAHPDPNSAKWDALIHLLSRLPTITHLSLAHWPIPCRASTISCSRGSNSEPHGNDVMAEAAAILRQLSRTTYCLKWLDMEGCSEWIEALTFRGTDPNGRAYRSGESGPEWNGSWRDIEWIGLGPGFKIPTDSVDDQLHSGDLAPDVSRGEEGDQIQKNLRRARENWNMKFNAGYKTYRGLLAIRKEGRGKWIYTDVDRETRAISRPSRPF
ncbi:uncharacterized protein N7498_009651 [Penicillium cinerascens]|uniref:Tafazzin n=1 Tax=Penicillium cinerascens TaxID=70096 RepID=A0A9W9JAE0_9EURO|nr:uncharacterized protein N7498_009651 [Penicillium cinerascens]KAJ5190666.1 hypothetical protein N7498_009651 [Penicillium cinerascens]